VGWRISYTAQSAGLYLISATNVAGAGSCTFRAVDTMLFNPRWDTVSGNDVQWGLLNVSDMAVTGTLALLDANGQVIVAVQVSIPPGRRIAPYIGNSDLNVARNVVGSVMFSHNGPPNSILGDAFLLSSPGVPHVAVKFAPVAPR